MNPFREMVLISLNEYKLLKNTVLSNTRNPNMTKELNEITDQYGQVIPADKKLKLEGEVISKYTQPNHTKLESSIPQEVPKVDYIKQHFDIFGPVNKKRALQIYNHLKTFSPNWNENGQLLNTDKQPIPFSNIVELIDYVTNTRRTDRVPAGFSEFVEMLEDTNTPRNFFSNTGILRIENYKRTSDPTISFDDKSYHTSTPMKWSFVR